eukprot:9815544-Karenia_brevis.AAC.1
MCETYVRSAHESRKRRPERRSTQYSSSDTTSGSDADSKSRADSVESLESLTNKGGAARDAEEEDAIESMECSQW